MGAFLSGLFSQVGPRLQEKHEQEVALQTQKKQGEFGTYWNSMNAAATRLSALKQKGELTPEETREAQQLAAQYQWSEQALNKLTKGSKPLAEAFQKVGGFVKQLLTQPSPKGRLRPPPSEHSEELIDTAKKADHASGPLQRRPEDQQLTQLEAPPSMMGARALAAEQSPEAVKRADADRERTRRRKEVKNYPHLSEGQQIEFIESGKLAPNPAQPRPTALDLRRQAEAIASDPESKEEDVKAAKGYLESLKKPEKKPTMQAGWAHYPSEPANKLHAIRIDGTSGKAIESVTGKELPEGAEQVNPSMITAQMRQDSYGTFGNYYRAALGHGLSSDAARELAGEHVEKEFNVKLSRQEQQIAIDAELSGIGGGSAKTPPRPPAPTPTAPESAASPARAPSPQSAKQAEEDRANMGLYLSSVLGVSPRTGGKAAGVRAMKGQQALAKLTGLDPMSLAIELASDKATAKALAQAVEVSGAFGRVQETLKQHGKVLLNAANAYGPGNVPLANRTIQWIEENAGTHPELVQYTLALNAVQREYARLISGGAQSRAMLPVSSSEKGEAVLRRDATMADVVAAVKQLQIEADTEQAAFADQIEGLKTKLKDGAAGRASSYVASPKGTLKPPPAADLKGKSTEELLKMLSGKQ